MLENESLLGAWELSMPKNGFRKIDNELFESLKILEIRSLELKMCEHVFYSTELSRALFGSGAENV